MNSRPIDCKIYPYQVTRVIEKWHTVKIIFHTRAKCPKKSKMYQLMPEADVRALIITLGKKAYGENKIIVPSHEHGYVSQMRNKIESAFFRRVNKIRANNKKGLSRH